MSDPATPLAPPLPMYQVGRDPDAWHRVTAPGGYESWSFDAESRDGATRLFAVFRQGGPVDRGYLRRYARFLRRPTRVRPPVANDLPSVEWAVYRHGRLAAGFTSRFPADAFAAEADRPCVRIGPNHMHRDAEEAYVLEWSAGSSALRGSLRFTPTLPYRPAQRVFPSRDMAGADHHWIPAAPRCDVTGHLDLDDGTRLDFDGRGCHDHHFGTAPLGLGLNYWIRGRLLTDTGSVHFQIARPSDPSLPDEVLVLEVDADGTRAIGTSAQITWPRRPGRRAAHPDHLYFGDALGLTNPTVLDSTPLAMRLLYDADSRFGRGAALCEIVSPPRPRRSILRRIIQRDIDQHSFDFTPEEHNRRGSRI